MQPSQQREITAVAAVVLVTVAGAALVLSTVPGATSAQDHNGIDSCTTVSEPGAYELTEDIGDSDADRCLVIETDGVTLDGNGHLVDGVDRDDSFGVYVNVDEGGQITVRDLTVRDWEEGVRIDDGHVDVEDVEAYSNLDGVSAQQLADGVWLDGLDVHDNTDDGIEMIEVTEYAITDTRSANNAEDGIYLDNADEGDVRNNVIEDNGENGVYGFDPDMTSISDNAIRDNAEDGILLEAQGAGGARAEDATIDGNEIVDNGDEGIHLRSLGQGVAVGPVTVIDNTVCDNDDKQFLLEEVPNVEMSGNEVSC